MKPYRLGLMGLFVWIMDRLSKLWILNHFQDAEVLNLFPGLNFRLAFNHGVAFSLLFDTGRHFPWILVVSSLLLCGVIILMLWRTPKTQIMQQVALTFILAGALGNICDRIYYGAVVDFIDVYYQYYHWPAFNIADSFICIGAFLLFIHAREYPVTKKGEV